MTDREPTNAELLAAINAIRTELSGCVADKRAGMHGELAARFDKLAATMAHNHELLQRAIRSYER